jgi:hypothetical protein
MMSVILLNVVAPVGCFYTTLFFLFEKNGTTLGTKDKERYCVYDFKDRERLRDSLKA